MDPKMIEKLSKVIKEQGDKLLTSEFKFTLTGDILRALNDSFSLIIDDENELIQPQTFQVTKPNNSKSNVFRELMFIYDFIQKTLVLKLTKYNDDDSLNDENCVVDISKFRNLSTLEIQKIPIKKIKGLQQLRQQLQELIVEKSLTNVRDLLTQCAGDNCTGFIWNSLKRVDFSYNNLERVDNSFEFTPYIQFLNLSHNKIVHITVLPYLPNLKILNLSYNQLTTIPKFSVESNKRLQTLILSDNCIEDIQGIVWLEALLELDLSNNCLLDHALLLPLCTLYSLRYLNLSGNPLAFHPKHRVATCRYLSTNARTIQFQLDNELLTKYENSLTGNYENYYPIFGHRMNVPRTRSQITMSSNTHTPTTKSISNTPENGSLGSTNSFQALTTSNGSASTKKSIKPRAVVIEETGKNTEIKSPIEKKLLKEGSKDHLVTKKEIEEMREKYGESWLFNQTGYGENKDKATGTRKRNELTDLLCESPPLTMNDSFEKNEPLETSTPEETILLNDDSSDKTMYKSINESATGTSVYASALEDTFVNDIDVEEEIVISEPEDNEAQFIVIDETTKEDLFLILTETTIKERNAMNGKTLTKWGIGTLLSVERVRSSVIHLSFDTIRKDKREREYRMDVKCCREVEKILRDYLSSRPLSEMNQAIYKCPKCNSQFCYENDDRSNKKRAQNDIKCPSCGNIYIIEIQKTNKCATSPKSTFLPGNVLSSLGNVNHKPASSIKIDKKKGEENSLDGIPKANHSYSSIESAFDSNQSVAGSSVEVLSECSSQISQTSQSSIEVLDNFASRKQSEERRISTAPSLDTIDDDAKQDEAAAFSEENEMKNIEEQSQEVEKPKVILSIANVNLTESSSSGSVCESVCTAYEQNGKKKSSTEESKSALEGIFKTSNLLLSKTILKKEPEQNSTQPSKPIEYNNEDLTKVDHRLKLHIFQNILEDNDEKFMWLVKCVVIEDDSLSSGGIPFTAIVVMSTKKFYLLKIVGEEKEEISLWLKKTTSHTIDQIEVIQEIPFDNGFSFKTKSNTFFHILLCDFKLSAVLHKHITTSNQILEINSERNNDVHNKLMKITNNNEIKYFAIFTACNTSISSATNDEETVPQKSLKSGVLLVTLEAIYCTTNFQWLCSFENANNKINNNVTLVQPMTNLVELENLTKNSFTLNFMDELENTIEKWKIAFDSFLRISKTLEIIDEIWRTIFCMPLVSIEDQLLLS
ncbi:hypothetical protein PVAND_014066 [Polypedilum vanderplanki]|uniref:LKB1 serine/threonine kinase interacting protein 1 N-terminal domain-containing protein n=1 Tax=Polypedilum vanderplanki TaxID=319348 RepID=A0A9J6CSD7_POLVA|nr:hypothetical protein PVAND_014066 [Polypedilum vanderplanki]